MAPVTLAWLLSAAVTASTAQDSLALARWLYGQGDSYRAVTEYKRASFGSPSAMTEVAAGLARSYLDLGQDRLARYHARRASELDPKLAGEMALVEWQALVFDGLHAEAAEVHDFLTSPRAGSDATAKLFLWEGARNLQRGQLEEGRRSLLAASQAATATPPARLAATILQRLQPPDLETRSPIVAGLLSATLPGAGQVYAGRVWEGLGLTVLTAGLVAGTVNSYRTHGRFELWLLPTMTFYFGGISRSVQLVEQQDAEARRLAGERALAPFKADFRALGLALR